MPKATRQLIAEILALSKQPPLYDRVLKYSEQQRRAPKGPGGGRWVKGGGVRGQALADVSPKHKEFPDPIRTGKTLPSPNPAWPGTRNKPYWRGKSWEPPTTIDPGMERRQGRSNVGSQDIARAAQGGAGTILKAKPRGAGGVPAFDPVKEKAKEHEHVLEVLKQGSVSESDGEGGAANASAFVTFDDAEGTRAIYKPERGENWGPGFANSDISRFVTNKAFSLANREAFAFQAGEELFGPVNNIVPETVLREVVDETHIEVDVGSPRGGGGGGIRLRGRPSSEQGEYYDADDLQQMYNSYREQAQEDAMDDVGNEMYELFNEAQNEFVTDYTNRADEMTDIWNEIIEEHPEIEAQHDAAEATRNHPAFPMGSAPAFQRREAPDVDPLEVLEEAEVDITASMDEEEREKVKAILLKRMQDDGAVELLDIDEDAVREKLEYGDWIEDHYDTEAQMYDDRIKDYDSWKRDNDYTSTPPSESTVPTEDPPSGGIVSNVKVWSGAYPAEPAAPAPVAPEKFKGRNQQAPHPKGGSFQHLRGEPYGDMTQEGGSRLAVFDYVVGAMDRHGDNLRNDNGNPVAIDNGYSMPAAGSARPDGFTFRSNGVGSWLRTHSGIIPDNLRVELADRLEKTDWKALADRHPMNALEKEAFLGRVERMKTALKTPEGLRKLWDKQTRM